MKKILHIVGSSMSRAGMETFIMNIYRQIDKSKYQFGFWYIHTRVILMMRYTVWAVKYTAK